MINGPNIRGTHKVVETYAEVLLTLDRNRTFRARIQYGTPQLSKCSIPLYENTMKTNTYNRPTESRRQVLDILSWADGTRDLLQIAEERGYKMLDLISICERLVSAGYLSEAGNLPQHDPVA